VSPCGRYLLTGAYNSSAHLIDMQGDGEVPHNVTIDVKFMEKRGKTVGFQRPYKGRRVTGSLVNSNGEPVQHDLTKKIELGAWHPKQNTFAVGKHNSLYLYSEKRPNESSRTLCI